MPALSGEALPNVWGTLKWEGDFPRFSEESSPSIVSGDVRGPTLATIDGAKTSDASEGENEVDGEGTMYGSIVSGLSDTIASARVSKALARTERLVVLATPRTAPSMLSCGLLEILKSVPVDESLAGPVGSVAARRRSDTLLS